MRWPRWLKTILNLFLNARQIETPMQHENYADQEKLYVCAMINNPAGYESRIRLFHEWAKHMAQFPNVVVYAIEGIYEGQEYRITEAGNPNHVQVFLKDEIWHKENLLNILMLKHLPKHAKKIAWIDADVHFVRPDWVEAALKALDTHPCIQLFSQCVDLDSHYKILPKKKSGELMYGMIYQWYRNQQMVIPCGPYDPIPVCDQPKRGMRYPGHCGFAWAARRDVLEKLGGLVEVSVVGSADYQMACAWMGDILEAVAYITTDDYKWHLSEWGERVKEVIAEYGPVGYIDGLICHSFHGMKQYRAYNFRANWLRNYSPSKDIIKDEQGVLCWNLDAEHPNTKLMGDIKWYFRWRKEDQRYPEHDIDTPDPKPEPMLDD
jgi:hypothetical protein